MPLFWHMQKAGFLICYFLFQKFQACSLFLWLYSPVSFKNGLEIQRQVFLATQFNKGGYFVILYNKETVDFAFFPQKQKLQVLSKALQLYFHRN